MHKPVIAISTLFVLLLGTVLGHAADYYFFDGGGGDSLWSTPENWSVNGSNPTSYAGESDPRDVIIVRTENNKRPLITDGTYITADILTQWSTPGAQLLNEGFDMTGGSIELVGASAKLVMGSNEDNIPIEVNMSGGQVVGRTFTVGGISTCPSCDNVDSDGVWNLSGSVVADFSQGGGTIGSEDGRYQNSTGTLNMSGDATLTLDHFKISSTGNGFVTLTDNAKITVLGDHSASMNDAINWGFLTGASGGSVVASYDSDLDQTVIMPQLGGGGLSGDYNGDGGVDAADYTVYQDNFGGDSSALNGNGSGSATVVQADYALWTTNFGTAGASGSASAAVPEPATSCLAVIMFMVVINFSRRGIGR